MIVIIIASHNGIHHQDDDRRTGVIALGTPQPQGLALLSVEAICMSLVDCFLRVWVRSFCSWKLSLQRYTLLFLHSCSQAASALAGTAAPAAALLNCFYALLLKGWTASLRYICTYTAVVVHIYSYVYKHWNTLWWVCWTASLCCCSASLHSAVLHCLTEICCCKLRCFHGLLLLQ